MPRRAPHLGVQIPKDGTFSTFGGTSADLQQRTHHCTHPPAVRYPGERSRERSRPNLKPAPVVPDRFEPRRTTMSTTSHPLHRELPHADDELMTIKGGGHPPATRPRRALHQRAANRWARGATPPRVDPHRCGDPRHVKSLDRSPKHAKFLQSSSHVSRQAIVGSRRPLRRLRVEHRLAQSPAELGSATFRNVPPRVWSPENPRNGPLQGVSTTFGGT